MTYRVEFPENRLLQFRGGVDTIQWVNVVNSSNNPRELNYVGAHNGRVTVVRELRWTNGNNTSRASVVAGWLVGPGHAHC